MPPVQYPRSDKDEFDTLQRQFEEENLDDYFKELWNVWDVTARLNVPRSAVEKKYAALEAIRRQLRHNYDKLKMLQKKLECMREEFDDELFLERFSRNTTIKD